MKKKEILYREGRKELRGDSLLLIILITASSLIYLSSPNKAALQTSNIKIREINPVVNVNNFIQLTAVDSADRVIPDATWESGSPDIAMVDPATGKIKGVKRGFATITARKGADSFSTFLGVALVEGASGVRV